MATGYTCIFITPNNGVLTIPEGWTVDYLSDLLPQPITVYDDRFVLFDHEPTPEEIATQINVGAGEFQAELRQPPDDPLHWRLRIRFPIVLTQETRGGIARIWALDDARLPASWGHRAVWWWVRSTAAKLKILHDYLYTTLGFGPVAGALAALDPMNQMRFLPNAVQTATGLTNQQQLNRVTAMRNALVNLGYAATALTAIVNSPAGKTEDDLIRALVADLGFEMSQLYQTMMRMD